MLMNTDSNDYLSRQELLEASKISPDMHQVNINILKLTKYMRLISHERAFY